MVSRPAFGAQRGDKDSVFLIPLFRVRSTVVGKGWCATATRRRREGGVPGTAAVETKDKPVERGLRIVAEQA
jgi:hypothetical protein